MTSANLPKDQAAPAFERIRANKNLITERWVNSCLQVIPAAASESKQVLVDSLSEFLDKICESLDPKSALNQANGDNAISPLHGDQRSALPEYDLNSVMLEYELLGQSIKSVLNETGGYSVTEYETIVRSLWIGTREAASAYVSASEKKKSRDERLFRLMVSEVKDHAIFMIDPDGYIITWNEGASRIKQYTEKEVIGKHYSMLYRIEDAKAGKPQQNLKLVREQGRHVEQWWRRKKDGNLFWAEVSMSAVYVEDKLLGFAKVVQDLTEKKKADEELRKAKQRAEDSNLMKTAFLANMSHEIRTPLNAILGFTEVLKTQEADPTERERYVDIIDRNGRALVSLIDDLLDISKVEAGKMLFEKLPFDIREMVAEVNGLFEARADQKGIEFFTRVKPSVPHQVVTDSIRLRQILNNIVGNAIKFTQKGTVNVTIEQIENGKSHPIIRIVVRDTGPGIPLERRANLFEPFMQADSSTTRKFGGSGLGLALSRKLAREMGGDVIVGDECEPDHGCTFIIEIANYVDLLDSKEAKSVANAFDGPRDSQAKKKVPRAKLDLTGKRLLIVEDSDDNRVLIARFLKPTHAEIDFAVNGAEGFEKAISGDHDLVIMDIQMPVLDGNDAAKKLRAAGFSKPMLALTAHALRDEVQRCLAAGFNAHVSKPINLEVLLREIEKILVRSASNDKNQQSSL